MELTQNLRYYYNLVNDKRVENKNATIRVTTAPGGVEVSRKTTSGAEGSPLSGTVNLLRRRSKLMPRLLKFTSWWQEGDAVNGGLTRKDVTVVFDTVSDTIKLGLGGEVYHCENVGNLR